MGNCGHLTLEGRDGGKGGPPGGPGRGPPPAIGCPSERGGAGGDRGRAPPGRPTGRGPGGPGRHGRWGRHHRRQRRGRATRPRLRALPGRLAGVRALPGGGGVRRPRGALRVRLAVRRDRGGHALRLGRLRPPGRGGEPQRVGGVDGGGLRARRPGAVVPGEPGDGVLPAPGLRRGPAVLRRGAGRRRGPSATVRRRARAGGDLPGRPGRPVPRGEDHRAPSRGRVRGGPGRPRAAGPHPAGGRPPDRGRPAAEERATPGKAGSASWPAARRRRSAARRARGP